MLSTFPNFKPLSIEDRKLVESFTDKLAPYSDFNFNNLWAWNIDGGRQISILNDNLVVKFTDYRTSHPFISFFGNNQVIETAKTLLSYAEAQGLKPELKFITEDTVIGVKGSRTDLLITEDNDNHDYIFLLQNIAKAESGYLKTRHKMVKRFLSDNPSVIFQSQKIQTKSHHEQIFSILDCWCKHKEVQNKPCEVANETMALKRLLATVKQHRLILSTVYLNNKMLGFSIDELLPNDYALSHFIKADIHYSGIYEFINQQVATYLLEQGKIYWNWEQDLNLEGLRKLKQSYNPNHFLKKFIITNN